MGQGSVAATELMPRLVVGNTELSCSKLKNWKGFLKPNFGQGPKPSGLAAHETSRHDCLLFSKAVIAGLRTLWAVNTSKQPFSKSELPPLAALQSISRLPVLVRRGWTRRSEGRPPMKILLSRFYSRQNPKPLHTNQLARLIMTYAQVEHT